MTTDPLDHVNVLINASVSNNSLSGDEDDRRLVRSSPRPPAIYGSSPRNNFPSYSHDDVSVRFRVSIHRLYDTCCLFVCILFYYSRLTVDSCCRIWILEEVSHLAIFWRVYRIGRLPDSTRIKCNLERQTSCQAILRYVQCIYSCLSWKSYQCM